MRVAHSEEVHVFCKGVQKVGQSFQQLGEGRSKVGLALPAGHHQKIPSSRQCNRMEHKCRHIWDKSVLIREVS